MYIDYALILTLLTLATGVLWALDRFFFRRRRGKNQSATGAGKPVEVVGSFFPILLVVLIFRSFLFEPFKIPSASMVPSLLIGDFIVVNKFAYGLRLPVLNTEFLSTGEPERGDVVVFRYPVDGRTNFIKRVIGLPGDTITYRNKMLFINGEPMLQEQDGVWIGEGINRNRPGERPLRRIEQLGEVSHPILVNPQTVQRGQQSWTVPEGHYFVMGDNRDASSDSRAWGFVPEDHLVGKATRIWMHWDCSRGCVVFDRIGDKIE
ncbi:signal peptidase I [Wenzhouxiangella marina]|uniref:Signal peptidase I n=1 Tax=Wenzhouxiangella marina TaxID=1579979 RepID=A0A0K0XXN6_9GAMM|nr:signal peptidase I [Wenzhouxiangella marina]AKS42440.1 Signal peptidase I [Wenzhouxiangella marina]MBB6085785.1 signal peptidase I [Wenzhouxiangella marina]